MLDSHPVFRDHVRDELIVMESSIWIIFRIALPMFQLASGIFDLIEVLDHFPVR